jgi:glycosyltransferase involved in cell wall biosynthesis
VILKHAWDRARTAYKAGGAKGLLTRVPRFVSKRIVTASKTVGLIKSPILTEILATNDAGRLQDWNARLTARGKIRGLETILLAPFEEALNSVPKAPWLKTYCLPEQNAAIAWNTALALSSGAFVAFDEFLNEKAVESAVIALGAASEDVFPRDAGIRPLLRRRALIESGMFRAEDGSGFFDDAVSRMLNKNSSKPSPIRLTYVVNGTAVRGGIRIVFEHCNRLRERGIETFIATEQEPFQNWFPGLKAPLISTRDMIRSDVTVATYWTTAKRVAAAPGARFYFIQHDESLFHKNQLFEREVRQSYGLPLELITISSWLVDLLKKNTGRTVHLVPNGINEQMFFHEPTFPKGEKVRVLVEGDRRTFWKGLVEAAEALHGLDVEVWSLGDTGIDSARHFNYPPQDELRKIYSSCDILLKTSWYEGMPLPHMEAMACGCAVLTTDIPGVRDYCKDGWNCLMARPKDVPDIREKLVHLMQDTALRKDLIEHGLETARSFGWDDKIDMLFRIYSEAADRTRAESS